MGSKIKPLIIPVFIPHAGCPHRCVFCNQQALTRHRAQPPSASSVRRQVERFLGFHHRKRPLTQVAFYGGNFLGLPKAVLTEALTQATFYIQNTGVDSIRFSTRPDTITDSSLDTIGDYPVQTIELGVQSMDDRVLSAAQRGHTGAQAAAAVSLLKSRRYEVGVQLMVGLPGDSAVRALASAAAVTDLKPDFVRIYPTLVLHQSPLARWYAQGRYTPLTLPRAVEIVKRMYRMFDHHGIPVIRMGLQATDTLSDDGTVIAGPYHPAFGHLVQAELFFDRISSALEKHAGAITCKRTELRVHPRSEAKLRGVGNVNLKRLEKRFDSAPLAVVTDKHQRVETIQYRMGESQWFSA